MNEDKTNQIISDKILIMMNILNTIGSSTDKDLIESVCKENKMSTQDFYWIYNAVKKTCI